MIVSTVMNLAIVPVLYIVVVNLTERKKRKKEAKVLTRSPEKAGHG